MHCRVAPTPSGFLHRGNAVNALLTSWWASALGASLGLRIDDVDSARVRPEYLHDIFDVLAWLGVEWSSGPRAAQQSTGLRTQRIRRAREALTAAREDGLEVYACTCSRRVLTSIPSGGCPRGCRDRDLPFERDRTALRVVVGPGTTIDVSGRTVDVAAALGDFVVWRRDDVPAYQWLSVVEDTDAQVTHILRGEDLLVSSAAQILLARYLPESRFSQAIFVHHPLIKDATGTKLSKSQLQAPRGLPRTAEELQIICSMARDVGDVVGIAPPR